MHALAGKKQSPEHIAKRVAAIRARGTYDSDELKSHCRALAASQIGKIQPISAIEKQRAKMIGRASQWLTGRRLSESHRRALSEYWKANPEKHNHYVDGKSKERGGERRSAMGRLEYRLWREKVFERDNWTCVICHSRGGNLNADHILPWVSHELIRYDVDNGRTVCKPCHLKLPTHGAGARKFMTNLER